jgi:FtsZ-binding cell division protein ZapB
MNTGAESDQFQLLEEKIDSLIEMITVLKNEKESIAEKAHIQEEKLADLNRQLESLRTDRDRARQRIVSILEKIENIGI